MIRITWEVEDGYVGKSRPQHYTLTPFEVEEYNECEDDEDRQDLLNQIVQDEFDNKIYPCIQGVDITE